MTAMVRTVLALSFAVLLASCGVKQAMNDAGVAIEQFHGHFDKEEYDAIWRTTSNGLRKTTTKGDFDRLLVTVHDQLGKVKASKQQGWQANTNNGVSTVVITTKTTFEKGEGIETFTFLREDGGLRLMGYYVQSKALL